MMYQKLTHQAWHMHPCMVSGMHEVLQVQQDYTNLLSRYVSGHMFISAA